MDLDTLTLRELQLESARALSVIEATSSKLVQFNKEAQHDSQRWYKAVIKWYLDQYGGLPSQIGPGKEVKLIYDV